MSIPARDAVWERSRAKGTSLLVMLALAEYADDHGVCWPTQARLATLVRVQRQTVNEVLRELVALGEIACERRGQHAPSVYRLTPGRVGIQMSGFLTSGMPTSGSPDVGPGRLQPSERAVQGKELPTSGVLSGGSKDLPRSPRARATRTKRRLPADFSLTIARRAYAVERGFHSEDVPAVFEDFRDYYTAAGTSWAQWDLVWMRWVRIEARKRRLPSPQLALAPSAEPSILQAAIDRLGDRVAADMRGARTR